VPGPRRSTEGYISTGSEDFERLLATALRSESNLYWVAIDDLYEDFCELAVSPWPRMTEAGQLIFARSEDDYAVVAVSRQEFSDRVTRARARTEEAQAEGESVVERPLRVGDVFAALTQSRVDKHGRRSEVAFSFGDAAIIDVTADARVLARVQAAVTDVPPIDDQLLSKIGERRLAEGDEPSRR
jgi:hypothetical protein